MRFADILVDLASVVKASRSVASKHIELRAHQLDRYGQTSSILRSLRQQETRQSQQSPGAAQTGTTTTPPEQPHDAEPNGRPEVEPESQTTSNAPVETAGKLRDDTLLSSSKQPHAHRNLFQSEPARKPELLRPDQGAILSELKRSAEVDAQQEKVKFSPQPLYPGHKAPRPKIPDDVPPDVNVDVFHTTRGSKLLEAQDELPRNKQPQARPPTPSWFKDFGHKKAEAKEDDSRISPNSAALSNEASQPPIKETSPVTSTGTAPVETLAETPSIDIKDGWAEDEHTNTASDVSSRAEEKEPIPSEPLQTTSPVSESTTTTATPTPTYALRESKVPATRLSRMWNYGGLAAGMVGGAISESFSRGFGGGGEGSVLLSAGNMERLVAKLSRMRGAALKIGQMMSFQDAKMLPAPIQEVLQRVQDRADYMPAWQRDRVLAASLGPAWRDLFDEFDEKPMAAASIGQVHRATLKSPSSSGGSGGVVKVAVKIQFPGVADSINSDLDNLSMLLTASKMLPKGLYLNKTIDNARTELGWECDYEREAACGRRYRDLLADEADVFAVPRIYAEASGRHVLTMEFMEGTGVTRAAPGLTQDQRDWIGTQVLRLCLREITEFRFMQTDPNWTNFLYDGRNGKLALLDFGASREFPAPFVARYVALLAAAARADRAAVVALSQQLGYLTGHESRAMLDAHVASILTLAEPFLASAPAVYDFRDQTITERVRGLIPVMVRERLAPPPEETYSLHRKLSGAFLLCARLGSRVRCREMFVRALEKAEASEEIGGELREARAEGGGVVDRGKELEQLL
ncbi:hypothetical protein SLS62_009136 [Diatrype stigma]|uniref:ABC1 atypical kinase-like domain-containing protein n=1 Tax=Diatrype stigma TaxID=117547 RepID=A0AAN9UN83_9PEZI